MSTAEIGRKMNSPWLRRFSNYFQLTILGGPFAERIEASGKKFKAAIEAPRLPV